MRAHRQSPWDWAVSAWLVPWTASLIMRAGAGTLRRRDVGCEHLEGCRAKGEPLIFAFWHGRLLLMPFATPGTQATILISQHRDGEYIARIAQRLGFTVERGSATRGGAEAFRKLVRALKEGRNVVVTPDGPKGPSRRVKSGVIELSRLSGMPIVPGAVGVAPWRPVALMWSRNSEPAVVVFTRSTNGPFEAKIVLATISRSGPRNHAPIGTPKPIFGRSTRDRGT